MTLNKHQIQGLPKLKCQTLSATQFEKLMIDAGYSTSGTAPAQGNRIKVWWIHGNGTLRVSRAFPLAISYFRTSP